MASAEISFDWKKWRVTAGIYLLTNIAFVVQRVVFDLQLGKPEDIVTSLIDLIGFAGLWALFAIPILILTSRWPLNVGNLFILIPAGLLLSVLHAAFYLLYAMSIPGMMTTAQMSTFGEYATTLAGLSHAWRFLSFGFLVCVSYAYDYYFLSKERERRASQLQVQLTEAKLSALRMQLHPHFLFNTLNAISVLIDDNPPAARKTLAQLSDLLRLALENVESHEVPLRREIDFLNRYLEIQQTRYESRLTVQRNIPDDVMDAQVPYLILQPVVENALKHGIDSVPGPGTITISICRENGRLALQVDDTGAGLRPGHAARMARGLGLANTQARLEQLYADRQSVKIEDILEGQGTRVTIILPYTSASDDD